MLSVLCCRKITSILQVIFAFFVFFLAKSELSHDPQFVAESDLVSPFIGLSSYSFELRLGGHQRLASRIDQCVEDLKESIAGHEEIEDPINRVLQVFLQLQRPNDHQELEPLQYGTLAIVTRAVGNG